MRLGRRTHTPFFVSLFPSFLTHIFTGITMLRLLQKRLFSSPAALCFSLSPMSAFSRSLAAGKVLPSSPEMKTPAWAESESNESAITKKVVGLARSLQETGRPPISIAKNFSKNFVAGQLYDPFDFSMDRLDVTLPETTEMAKMMFSSAQASTRSICTRCQRFYHGLCLLRARSCLGR